jgi:hypothetical protein
MLTAASARVVTNHREVAHAAAQRLCVRLR